MRKVSGFQASTQILEPFNSIDKAETWVILKGLQVTWYKSKNQVIIMRDSKRIINILSQYIGKGKGSVHTGEEYFRGVHEDVGKKMVHHISSHL